MFIIMNTTPNHDYYLALIGTDKELYEMGEWDEDGRREEL